MRNIFRNNLRLKPSILTAFFFLTVPVFFTIIAVTYFSNDNIARTNAKELVERFRIDALESIEDDFNPLKSLIRSAAALGDQDPGFYRDNRSLKYFYSILLHSPKIVSVYAGLSDGSLRQTRRIDPSTAIRDTPPPPGARYAYRWIVPKAGAPILDHYVFLDAEQKELGSIEHDTTYDPRVRPWYRAAEQARTTIISDPDVFASEALIGVTVAAPFYADGKLAGVAAADITLSSLGAYLAERKISPGTLSYILDHQGRVIAASDLSNTSTTEQGSVELRHISSLDNPLPAMAFSAHPRQGQGMFSFSDRGTEYVASLSPMAAEFGKTWQLFTITPLSDFTGPFQANNDWLVIFGLLVVAVQVVIIYFLTGVISAPLEKLAFKVGRIQELGTEQLPSVSSPIREISVLSKAIDTLDVAVKSFSAFVPVGLVTQLLQSEQKLELGGHSRFLTIFFSDLEAFSTLSEQVPSQELLLRVSAYLELVTKTVNQELGTIDKFIGDGVMAFWGAPALLGGSRLAGLRGGDAHPARHGCAERALAGGRDEAVQDPHRHPQRRRDGGQYRLQGAHGLHRDGRRREHRVAARGHQQGIRHPHLHQPQRLQGSRRTAVRAADRRRHGQGTALEDSDLRALGRARRRRSGARTRCRDARIVQDDTPGLRGADQGRLRVGAAPLPGDIGQVSRRSGCFDTGEETGYGLKIPRNR